MVIAQRLLLHGLLKPKLYGVSLQMVGISHLGSHSRGRPQRHEGRMCVPPPPPPIRHQEGNKYLYIPKGRGCGL